jgi:multiple sugar transport system substrate-binding protein
MKSKFWVFLTLLVIVSTLLASCQTATPPAAQPVEPTQAQEEAKPAPTAAPKEEAPVDEAEPTDTPEPAAPTEAVVEMTPTATEWTPLEVKEGQTKVLIFVGFGTGTSAEQQAVHKKLQEEFNSTHEDIQIEFLTVPWGERITKFSTMLAGGISPDLVMPIGVGGIAEFYEEWADLEPYIVADNYDMTRFVGKTTEIHKYPEKGILGLPMCVYPTAVHYNMDIFDAAGVEYPPHKFGEAYADGDAWDLDKVIEISKLMSLDANGNDANSPAFDPENMKQYGWANWDWSNNIEWAMKFGDETGRHVSMDNKDALFDTQQYKDALTWFKDAIWTHHIAPTSAQAGAFYDNAGDPFGSGMLAMWETHTWMKWAWDSWNTSFAWDLASVPAGPNGKQLSMVDADTFVIPKSSQHKDEAWEVVKWFFEEKQLQTLIDNYGCMPADKNLAANWVGSLKAKYPEIDAQVYVDALDYTEEVNHEMWRPEYTKSNDIAGRAREQILTGTNLDVNAVLDAAAAEYQALLDEYWKSK